MKMRNLFCSLIISLILFSLLSEAPAAEKYPSKEIQLVLVTRPGGSTDISARIVVEKLKKILDVPIVVTNRPGAGGASGVLYIANSKPDGYTISTIHMSDILLSPATNPKLPYTYTTLDPLCKYSHGNIVVFCKGDAPWKSLEDLVADAKKRPGRISYGVTNQSGAYFQLKNFIRTAGIDMLYVPTEASGQTITRVLGGNLDLGSTSLAPLVDQMKTGQIRGLFFTTPRKTRMFPEIPNMKEKGYNPVIDTYDGFFAPRGLPKPIRETLEKALEIAIKDPEVNDKLGELTLSTDYLPGEAFAKLLQEEYRQITEFIKTDSKK